MDNPEDLITSVECKFDLFVWRVVGNKTLCKYIGIQLMQILTRSAVLTFFTVDKNYLERGKLKSSETSEVV